MTRDQGEPDAWDECRSCGHDRDDHTGPDAECTALPECLCTGFEE